MNVNSLRAVVSEVPAQVWRMILVLVGTTDGAANGAAMYGDRVRELMRRLTINKEIERLAREELVKLGRVRIRCTVAQIPRAIRDVFAEATELCVIGSAGAVGSAEAAEAVGEASEAASAVLAATGDRFGVFVSDETDTASNMRWLPRRGLSREQQEQQEQERRCLVLVDVSEKRFRAVAGNVAEFYRTGRMEELVICYSGARHELPDLSPIDSDGFDSDGPVGPLRVKIENGDFSGLDDGPGGPKFRSPAVTELKFAGCDLVRLPPVSGFPNLRRLDVVESFFNDYDALHALTRAPVPPIEHLQVARCGGEHDGSPIAGLTKLKTLVMADCMGGFPDFDEAERVALHGRLVGGELNAGGTGCLCKVIVRALQVRKPERESTGLAMCDSDCCGPCDCGYCSECE